LLYKVLEFQNAFGQKIEVLEIPVIETDHHYYFLVQARLQIFVSSLYNKPQEKSCYSFRDYLKRKMKWSDYENLYGI